MRQFSKTKSPNLLGIAYARHLMNRGKTVSRSSLEQLHESNLRHRRSYGLSFNNPLEMRVTRKMPLNEGLINTYPLTAMIKYIVGASPNVVGYECRYIPDYNKFIRYDGEDVTFSQHKCLSYETEKDDFCDKFDLWELHFKIPLDIFDEDDTEKLENALNLGGYQVYHKENLYDDDYRVICANAVHPFRWILKDQLKVDYLFHVTKATVIDKIKRVGLTPRSDSSEYNYNDRVYLCWKLSGAMEIAKDIDSRRDGHGQKIVVIDVNKLPRTMMFSYDPSYDLGVFTTDNIPPSAICDIKSV